MRLSWLKKFKFRSKNSQKKTESFDAQLLGIDFFSQLVYMAAVATAGIARDKIVYHAAKLPYIGARYFRKVDFVAKMFNHDYPQACRIIGEKTNESEVKAFLLRLSSTLGSGEDVAGFLERESQISAESYGNNYERRLDLLKKWGDAYVSLIMTTALVTVMAVVSMMIGNITIAFIVALSTVTVLASFLGSWFLYRTAPRELKNHSLPICSKEQLLMKNLTRVVLPAGLIIVAFLIVMKAGIGPVLLTAGVFSLPVGLVAVIDDRKINQRDMEVGTFLRSLGGLMQAIGATASEAMGRLEFRSLGSLKENVDLLYTRILNGINLQLCWDRFVGETGSEQVNRSVRIFWDAISLGGEPQRVGNEASTFAMKISFLRAQRSQIASGFTWLTIAMHAVLAALSIFIFSVFGAFSKLVETIMPKANGATTLPNMPSFGIFSQNSAYLGLLHFMVLTVVLILTVANALSIHFVNGGHILKLLFYLALTALISGGVLTIVPQVVNLIFTPMMK